MLENLNPFSATSKADANPEEAGYAIAMQWTGWVLFLLVAGFAMWFFSYTNTDRGAIDPLNLQSIDDTSSFSKVNEMRARLRAAPESTVHRTGLDTPPVWVRLAVPAAAGEVERTIHMPEKNIGVAEFVIFGPTGREVLRGQAGAKLETANSVRTFPGFAIDLPAYLAEQPLEIIFRFEPLGITKIRGDIWRSSDFEESQAKAQQRTILLIGALVFLALYALAAANSGRVEHFLVFGIWLLARCGFVMMESGFNYFAFGELAGSQLGLMLRQFTYLALPFATLMLIRSLFRDEIKQSVLDGFLRRMFWLSAGFLAFSLIMPFPIFQSVLWVIAALTAISVIWTVYHTITRARDITTYWFLAGVFCDALGSVTAVLYAMGLLGEYFSWFQAEQVSLIAAVLTGMAVGTTISKERQRRIDSQATAIGVLGKYEDVYRTVPIGLVSIGHAGHIERYNEGFARMFGLGSLSEADENGGTAMLSAEKLDAVFPADLRERIKTELTQSVECDFEFKLTGHETVRWLRVLARGAPDSYEASATDVTEQRNLQERLAKAAEHDPLTGALNRLGLTNRMEAILEEGDDLEHVALCYVDLDRFKMLNDMFGHHAGDAVLVDVIKRFRSVLGSDVILSRLGGDEFVIVLPPADQSVQEGLAWKALEAITEDPFRFDDKSFSVTASVGVFHLVSDLSQSELIAGADRSCQEAKRKGRNQVVMCADSSALVQKRMSELSLVARLHDDRTFDEFELVAQPIVALNSSVRTGCEILLRHRGPNGELLPAGPLITAAEQNGEMACIDRWVVRRSLEWLSRHNQEVGELSFVSINLSGSSLNDEFFKTFVIALLQKHRNVANRIVLEVTESVAMQDIFMMMKFIESVRQTGARIALDDFGSGYSNFASLTDVQASFLKIDGRFVNSLRQKGSAKTIIKTIGLLAHELRMECIAEWVEDTETLDLLRSIGIDYGQGHILAKPVRMEELLEAVKHQTIVTDAAVRKQLNEPIRFQAGDSSTGGNDRQPSSQTEVKEQAETNQFHAL